MNLTTYFVTLNWNTTELLKQMVESVEATTPEPHKWIIVDNGSETPEFEKLREVSRGGSFYHTCHFPTDWPKEKWIQIRHNDLNPGSKCPDLTVVRSEVNLGCVKGHNLAFDLAEFLSEGQPFQIVMINTDVVVSEKGWLGRVHGWANQHERVGIVGFEHSRGAKCASLIFLDDKGYWYVHERQNMGEEPAEAESVGMGFALLRWPVVEAGLRFDPVYEMYYKQDDDFIFQMRARLGLEAWVFPVGCVHAGRASIKANAYKVGTATGPADFDEMKRRNQETFAATWAWALRPRRPGMAAEREHLAEMKRLMAQRRQD